jgi:prophage DNA circulation protein
MSWEDRLREAAYTSPSGERVVFTYEDVGREVDKKTTGHDFPDVDGTFVQDLGHTGRKYPLTIYFWGENYDEQAEAFESMLLERGLGKLEHPIYGVIDVVPFGTISRSDGLKSAAGQCKIEVVFWETTGIVYPNAQNDLAADAVMAIQEFNDASAEEFAEATDTTTSSKLASFKASVLAAVANIKKSMGKITATVEEVQAQFDAIESSIQNGISLLVGQPLALAHQISIMVQAPSRAASLISDRLAAYKNLATSIMGKDIDARTRDLVAMGTVTGAVLTSLDAEYKTRSEAIQAAEELLVQLDAVTAWRDGAIDGDIGFAYASLQRAVSLASGYLVWLSFGLKQERRITTDRAHSIIDLCYDLYRNVDDSLDFFIASNGFSGAEILEIPIGREVVYYV